MKIESDAILNWLQNERNRLRKELTEARENGWEGRHTVLQGNLSEVNKMIKAVKDYRGD